MDLHWRRWQSVLAAGCVVAAVGMAPAFAAPSVLRAPAGSERVISYSVRIAIHHDGSILVTEQIVYDFGDHRRHGIVRDIPVLYPYSQRYNRYLSIDVRSVRSSGPGSYSVDRSGDSVVLKVGNPHQTVTGVHTYWLTYLVRGSMNAFAGYDELRWNATGDQWAVPIGVAHVIVTAPAAPTRVACWAGPHGSRNPCEQARILPQSQAADFTQQGLGPHKGLTVAVDLPKGVVVVPRPLLRQRWSLQRAFALTPVSLGLSGGLLAVLAVLGAVVLRTRRRHRHISSAAATPAFGDQQAADSAPPENLRPGQVGTLLDGVANSRDLAGTIADLAARGFLRIEEIGEAHRDWRLTRLDHQGDLLEYEQILLSGVFEHATCVQLSDLGAAFADQLRQAQDALYTEMVSKGWFTTRPDQARRRWRAIGAGTAVAGVVAVIVIAATSQLGIAPIPIALAGLALVGGARWMPVRTAEGAAMTGRVQRFRRFIETDAVAQAKGAGHAGELYGYLPYAVAFGCTRKWADLAASLPHNGKAPSWFQGSSEAAGGVEGLSAASHYFSSFHYWAASTAAGRGQRSSGGFRGGGFHGGGFSGGGFGGGGGRSW